MSERLSAAERGALLEIARGAIASRLGSGAAERPEAGGALGEKRGVFVTLRRKADGELRGCVGFSDARLPLAEAVEQAAQLAAFEDGRFPPVAADELPRLSLDVSVLSPLAPIAPDAVEVGRHGLLLRCAGQAGLFLPLVPVQFGWDRDEYLAQLCRKAGLPRDAWRRPDAELFAFTTELIEE